MEHRWKEASFFFFPSTNDFASRHWGYEENEFVETPMYPRHYYEAGCVKCHSGQIGVDRGDDTRKRRKRSSCTVVTPATRSTTGASPIRKPGPDLTGIAGEDDAGVGDPLDQRAA